MQRNEPSIKISRFLGVNNTDDPADLGADESGAGYLVDADNVDITNSNKIQRRPGNAIVTGFGGSTAAYSAKNKTLYHVSTGGVLYRVDSMSPLARTSLATGIATSELHWAEAGNMIFFCGASKGIIIGNDVLSFGIEAAEAPGMTEIEGSLPAGRYLAACVFQDASGRQGGCAGISEIDITQGGIVFDAPTLTDHTTLLYVSRLNGESLFLLAEITEASYSWYGVEPTSIPLDDNQIGGYPPPENSECVAFYESKVWVSEYDQASNTSFVHASKPFWYHLFPLDGYIPVPGKVLDMASDGSALVIGTTEAIYAYNDTLVQLADYGLIPGQALEVFGKVFMWTERGYCSFPPFQNLTDATFSVAPGRRVAVGVREYGGMNTLIACTDTGGTANNRRTS